jgi:hypothetical protein
MIKKTKMKSVAQKILTFIVTTIKQVMFEEVNKLFVISSL